MMAHSPEVEAGIAHRWHSAMLTGLIVFALAYLAVALLHLPHPLVVITAVGAFLFAMGYMGTTIWVYSLRTERKRTGRKSEDA